LAVRWNGRDREEQNMREGDRFTSVGSAVEIACQCGRSACAEVIALPWCVYEEAQREPQRLLLAPGHELPGFRRVRIRYDSFVVVSSEQAEGGRERGERLERLVR
jgi:hypothetical protein